MRRARIRWDSNSVHCAHLVMRAPEFPRTGASLVDVDRVTHAGALFVPARPHHDDRTGSEDRGVVNADVLAGNGAREHGRDERIEVGRRRCASVEIEVAGRIRECRGCELGITADSAGADKSAPRRRSAREQPRELYVRANQTHDREKQRSGRGCVTRRAGA